MIYSRRKQAAALREVADHLLTSAGPHYLWDTTKAVKARGPYRMIHVGRALNELMRRGWVTDGWEDIDQKTAGRPPRRFYVVTPGGRTAMADMLEAIS